MEEILDKRRKRKKVEYLVSWKGFGPQENSWEPAANTTHCQDLVNEFNSKFPDVVDRYHRSRRR
jgi:hypothetical protein